MQLPIDYLRLKNFKSFGGVCELSFSEGITAIAGVNGSGKSNIVDALRWALGEKSLGALRISCQSDLIFRGSPSMEQAKETEVVVKLRHKEDAAVLSRQYTTEGGSVLQVDGFEIRERDLAEFKSRFALENDRFAFIGRDEIAEVIHQHPVARRRHLELLFGIDRCRKHRDEKDSQVEALFTQAMTDVADRFNAFFQRLFDGGEARLSLLEEDTIWDKGVEIYASPPEWCLYNIFQLGGYHRQLFTAMAYILATLEVARVPLVVLDGVDTALNEYDLIHFIELVKERSKRLQIIVMTRQRSTIMEYADVVYDMPKEKFGFPKIVKLDSEKKPSKIPLIAAIKNNETFEALCSLTKGGADINARDYYGWTALIEAAYRNENPQNSRALIEAGADVNAKNSDGWTALMQVAFHNKYPEILRVLIEAGADVNAKNNNGETALMMVAENNCKFLRNIDLKILRNLIEAGADVNAKNNSGWTALMKAASNESPKIFRVLIEAGADVNAKGTDGFTALMIATNGALGNANHEIPRLLIEMGADVNAKDNIGCTALMNAVLFGASLRNLRLLIEAGADVNVKDNYGWTALMTAASENNSPKILRALIEAGADINAKDNDGWTALMIAARFAENSKILRALIEAGAAINAKDNVGRTALMIAARFAENSEILRLLIEAGADVNVKDNDGRTALMIATENNKGPKVLSILIDAERRSAGSVNG